MDAIQRYRLIELGIKVIREALICESEKGAARLAGAVDGRCGSCGAPGPGAQRLRIEVGALRH